MKCTFPRLHCDCIACRTRRGLPDYARPPIVPTVTFWVSDFGEIKLPDDFPTHIFRNDGWWDKRFTTLRVKWEAWIAVEEAKLRLRYTIPNRLHGAAVNAEGCAI